MICNKVEKCIEEQLVNQKTTACVNKNIECIEVSDNRSRIKCEVTQEKIHPGEYPERSCDFI